MSVVVICFSCNQKEEFPDKVGFRAECSRCHADLHACKNCQFYDAKAYNECREPSADPIREKERANYCDYFQPNASGVSAVSQKDQLRAAAEALFKKGGQ